ncbi:MAG TPA: hypothetical protein VGT78_11425 [Rhizomicrobium sp.]|nr:hypothetical protein [Rhizomicrobium sp.]
MMDQTHEPAPSMLPKIIGGVVAVGLVGAVLYALYGNSRTDATTDNLNAYNNCKAEILAHLARPDTAQFLDDVGKVAVVRNGSEFTLPLNVRASNGFGGKLTVAYRCTIEQVHGDFFQNPQLERLGQK